VRAKRARTVLQGLGGWEEGRCNALKDKRILSRASSLRICEKLLVGS
jgi:hypothetical protein